MIPPFSVVCNEHEVDLLLLEEFVASKRFARWFIRIVSVQLPSPLPAVKGVVKAWHSHSEGSGESDLEVDFLTTEGCKLRLYIENKVAAQLQPAQADRYRARGREAIAHKQCALFCSVIVAPKTYFPADAKTKGFDARVEYETIQKWFLAQNELGERRYFKADILSKAIERAAKGWQPVEDAAVLQFWMHYWKLVKHLAPKLNMKKPQRTPSTSNFIYFRPDALPSGVRLVHKMSYGNVDLQFAKMGKRLAELRDLFEPHLGKGMFVEKAAGSAVIRINVPVLNISGQFERQRGKVGLGIRAAKRLLVWLLSHNKSWPKPR